MFASLRRVINERRWLGDLSHRTDLVDRELHSRRHRLRPPSTVGAARISSLSLDTGYCRQLPLPNLRSISDTQSHATFT